MSDTNLVVLGVVLLVIGVFTAWFCIGIPILIAGLVILIYGAAKEEPRVVMAYPYQPSMAVCSVCGSPLQWVSHYMRWYCWRCAAYR